MNVNKIFFSSVLLSVILVRVLSADEISLISGDKLIGVVKSIDEASIIIDTSFAKGLKIKHEMIETMSTLNQVNVYFKNGNKKEGLLLKSKGQLFSLMGDNDKVSFDVSELASADAEIEVDKTPNGIKYSGSVDIGLSRSSGNEDDEDYQGELSLQARTIKNRYTLEIAKTIEKNDGDKTQDETFGSLQLDHFINEKWYGFASVSFEEDFEELLDLRSTYSLGSGYQFFDEDDLKMKGEIGLAYVDENFDEDEDNEYTGGRWAYDYEQKFFPWVSAFHGHEGFFSLENDDDINVRSSTGFKFPLNDYINAKLQANIDWNKTPAEGAATTDKEYIFTLGYEF